MRRIAAFLALLCLAPSASLAGDQSVPRHVLTADFFGAPYGSSSISPEEAAPHLTWAQVSVRVADAVAAAGIKTQYYIDPALTIANRGDQLYTSDESTFAHDCAGNRVTIPYHGLTEDLMAFDQASMRAVFKHWVDRVAGAVHYDALFEDDADLPSEYMPFRAMPCHYSDAQWLRDFDGLNQASPLPVIVGGLNASKRPRPSGVIDLLSSDKTLGENYEHCYASDTQPKLTGAIWEATENTELAVARARKLFQCTARDNSAAVTSGDGRLYVYSSFLLTYDPRSSVIWEEYTTPSRFRVEPETQLVALDPLTPLPSEISGLQLPGGTYAREFGRCYISGRFVGPCAAVVNPDSSAHSWSSRLYRHTLTLHGGGVLDGGTISADGPPPPSQLPPASGTVVFR